MSSNDSKYFKTTKKGEIKELQDDLNSLNREKVKEAVKKVIAAMTVGKDVSGLFTDIIKSMGTDDIELKKLVYLYIINYARSQPEKAILVVSMFQSDATKHPNPLVRALAIRTMGCVRVETITDYLCDPLNKALGDQDPYVRKTAAICVAKLYDINNELVEERGMIDKLRDMIGDSNPMVVANAVAALAEICESSGKDYFRMQSNMLSKLLTALNECTEWGRVFILDALAKFDANPTQAKDICERVGPQLQHSNSAVVMSAVKCVVKNMSLLKKEDVTRFQKKLSPPLVTLVSSTQPEIQYVALRNISLIVQKYPRTLQQQIRVFFVKFNDESYVKMEKLEILIKLTTRKNVSEVLLELKEYAMEIDVEFVRKAVRAIGRIAIALSTGAQECVQVLSELVRTKVNYVVQESVVVIKDIFRRYPRKYEKIISTLCENLDSLDEPEAKASMIWIIGEYAERIRDAGDRLEYFVDSYEEESSTVQLQILTATVKLFLKKPDKSKQLVTKVLNLATEKSDNPDLRDRGYVYWRLLSSDPAAAKAVILAEKPVISSETFQLPKDYLNKLLGQISSLASVYHRDASEFVRGTKSVVFTTHRERTPEEEEESEESDSEEDSSDSEEEKEEPIPKAKSKVSQPQSQPKPKPQQEPVMDLLDMFTAPTTTPQQPQSTMSTSGNTTTPGGLDDFLNMGEFDPFGESNQSVSIPSDLPELTNCLLGDLGAGLNLDIGYQRKNSEPTMVIKANNQGQNTISRIDLKFNKNYLGIQPESGTLALNGSLGPGSTQYIYCKLGALKAQPQPTNPLNTTVQMACRSVRNDGQKPPVHVVSSNIPSNIFWSKHPQIQQREFLESWKSLASGGDQSCQFKKIRIQDSEAVKALLEKSNCIFVAPRKIPNRGISLYFSTSVVNDIVYCEVSIANTGACRIVCRSNNKYKAFVVANTMKSMLES